MFVKKFSIYLCALLTISCINSMQPPTPKGWGWKAIPDTYTLALEEKTAETIKDALINVKEVAEALTKTAYHLSEGLTASTNSAGVAIHASVNELSKMLTIVSHQVVEVCKTLQPLADKGLVVHVGADTLQEINNISRALNTVAQNGISTKLSIDPATLKTFFIASSGFTILTASIFIIYKELTKSADSAITNTVPTKKGWLQTIKSLAQNRYLIGTTGILSGLLLIAKSNRIAMAY